MLIPSIIIVIILILYNWFVSHEILSGNWAADSNFLDKSGIDEFLINIKGFLTKSARYLISKNKVSVFDEDRFWFFTSPLNYFIVSSCSGFFNSDLQIFDKGRVYFDFNPLSGFLKLYSDSKVFGEFHKVNI